MCRLSMFFWGPALASLVACGSSSNSGVVSGTPDDHCQGATLSPASDYTCPSPSGTASDANSTSDYGATMYGSEGDDDDCKYHVTWSADDVEEHKDVTFTVKATWLADGTPLTGADTQAEIFLSDTHTAANTSDAPKTTENPNGTYTIKPGLLFDEKGQWTVRFHFYENCVDSDNSLHGHAAFYVNVP